MAFHIGVNVRPDRIAFVLLLAGFFRSYNQFGFRRTWILEEKVMALFFLVLLTSWVMMGPPSIRNRYISKIFGFSVVPAALFMISRRLDWDPSSFRVLTNFFLVVGFYLGITGLSEHYSFDSLVFPKYILDPDVGIHYGRVRGPFVQAAVMGGASITIALYILWFRSIVRKTWINWVVFAPLLASCYFTYTRAVWLQAAASVAVLGVCKSRERKAVGIVIFTLALVYLSGIASKFSIYETSLFKRRDAQIDDRINIYYASWKMFLERPILGFGFGQYEIVSDQYFREIPGVELRGQGEGQHHTILGLMCETGILGAIPFCLIYCLLLRECYRIHSNRAEASLAKRSFALTQLAMIVGTIIGMQFSDFSFYNYLNNLMFWTAGMTYARWRPGTNPSNEWIASKYDAGRPIALC